MQQSLDKLGNGALTEMFNRAFSTVVKNMKDPNTPFKDTRQITITITMKQDEERLKANTQISVKTKLAPVRPFETSFSIGQNISSGEVMASEAGAPAVQKEDLAEEQEERKLTRFRKEA